MAIQVQKIPVEGTDSTIRDIIVVSNDAGGIAIDYTEQLTEILSSLQSIANSLQTSDSTKFADAISIHGNRIASALEPSDSTSFADHIAAVRNLAEGSGIHTVGPYDWLGYSSLYKLYVEDTGAIGLAKLIEYKDKINNLPKAF